VAHWRLARARQCRFRAGAYHRNINGYEVQISLPLHPDWSATLGYTATNSKMNGRGPQITGIPETELKLNLGFRPESQPYGLNFSVNHVGDLNGRLGTQRGNYTIMDLSGHYELGATGQHLLVVRIENLTDKVYATRVDRGNLDSGGTYLYDNLGMRRTLHASYTYSF